MSKKIMSCFLISLIFLLQVGCATMYEVPKKEFVNYYIDKGKYPSIIIKSNESSIKIPYDTYYFDSDTFYIDIKEVESQLSKNLFVDKIAIQDVESIQVAGTNPFLGLTIVLIGLPIITVGVLYLFSVIY